MEQNGSNIESARDFVEAKDVKGNILYRKDGSFVGYLRVFFFNLELKNNDTRASVATQLTSSFQDDRNNFVYFTLPREIDLDKYKDSLKEKHLDTENLGKRHILANMILEGTRLSSSGENYEHQHFMKIWSYKKDEKKAREEILERLKDIKARFRAVEIETNILSEIEIIKICNLFGNNLQASFEQEQNADYTPIMHLH